MKATSLENLQTTVLDKTGFISIDQYAHFFLEFLKFLQKNKLTRVISPSQKNYIFYQFSSKYNNKITRPINSDLFIENIREFKSLFRVFMKALNKMKIKQDKIKEDKSLAKIKDKKVISRVIYSMQQGVGCVGDSFDNPNTCRKRIGQIFERLIQLIIKSVGLECSPRTINIPIPNREGYKMSYELDIVFSRKKAILTSESHFIHESEIVGSIKTTSKDRIDKIFLDKFMLQKLIGRDIPVIAVFLHDVQRAVRGNNIFGINSTFKRNHFLGYTVALNKLDGVYYIDPRPEMRTDKLLREQIYGFQKLLFEDLWSLSN